MIINMTGGGAGGGKLFAAIGVTYPAGSTCTCTNGSKTLTAKTTSGQWVFPIPAAGTWIVTATDGTDSDSQTVEITAEGQSVSVELSYRVFLFTANNKYPEITGGWTSGADTGSATIVMDDYIGLTLNASGKGVYVHTVNLIDLAPYSKIRFNGYSADPDYAAFGVSKKFAQNMGYDPGSTYVSYVRPSATLGDKTIDISSLNDAGGYYVVISAYQGTSHNSKPFVYEVELIK